jgi:hypothetical protein
MITVHGVEFTADEIRAAKAALLRKIAIHRNLVLESTSPEYHAKEIETLAGRLADLTTKLEEYEKQNS